MAFAAKAPGPQLRGDPLDVAIPRLSDDAAYAQAADLLAAFRARLALIETEKERLDIQRHFALRARENDSETDTLLRARLARLDKALVANVPAAPPEATEAPAAAAAAGLAVLNGGTAPPPPDHAAQVRELARQHDVIRAAIFAQTEVVDRIADEVSFRFAKQITPAWNALQLEVYRAAQELSRAVQRVHEMRSRITSAGIRGRSDLLLTPNVRAPLMLGSETQFDSEISGWRRILERLGIF